SPVVSVSNTISRMVRLSSGGRTLASSRDELLHQARDLGARLLQRRSGIDDVIGPRPLFGVGHLQRENALEPFGGHSGPREDARALDILGGGDHGDPI